MHDDSAPPPRDSRPVRPAFLLALALAILGTAVVLAAAPTAPITGPHQGNAAQGKKIYKEKCVACHMADGRGGFKVTGNPTPDWRDPKRQADSLYDDDYLRDCIVNGKIKSGMVAWSKQGVKPAQVEHLIAHIRTLADTSKKRESKPAK